MRCLILVILATLTPSVSRAQAPVPPSTAAPAGNAENGKKMYLKYGCQHCHSYAAQGTPDYSLIGGGPRIGPGPIAFSAFSTYLRRPTDQMPPYTAKLLPDSEVADIYAWLRSIPAPPPVSSIPLLK